MSSSDGARIAITWDVREGAQTIIDRVLVSGNARTNAELIRREVGLQPGQPLGDDALIEGQRRLAALGLFRRVRVAELPHGASNRPRHPDRGRGGAGHHGRIRRRCRGRPPRAHRRRGTGGRSDRSRAAGFFEVSRRNLWGKNRSISLFTRVSLRARDPAIDSTDPTDQGGYGFNEYRVLGTFREPRPFNRPGDLQFTVFLEQAIRSSFNFTRRGVQTEYARRISEQLTVTGRYAIDTTRLFDQKIRHRGSAVNVDRFFPQARLSTFTGSVLRDSRDDVLDPTRGTVLGRRRLAGGARARLGDRIRQVLRAGLLVSAAAAQARHARHRRAHRPRRRVRAAGDAGGCRRTADPRSGRTARRGARRRRSGTRAVLRRRRYDRARVRPRSAGHVLERASLRSSHRHAQRSGVPDRWQRPGAAERRAQDGLLEGAERCGLRRRRQRVSPRQSD